MNLIPFPAHERLRCSAPVADHPSITASLTEFFLLEECVARCESLAEALCTSGEYQTLVDDLSECIAACQTYIAAKSRESRYEVRLRTYCIEVLAATSSSCGSLQHKDATACSKIIRASLRLMESPDTAPSFSSN